ncbi:MAG: hypothetical protein COA54_01215 [Thiotrichaceae bacterium]|nr:MAG: hypothetical protein COA54_01215 [Thiotrichaceae bacterium]
MAKLFLPNLMFLYGFVACGIPLSRVELGPMPLYFIDIIAFLVLFMGRGHIVVMYRRHRRISAILALFILTLLPTYFGEFIRMSPLEPTYLLARTILHILAVWSVSGFLRAELNLKKFLLGLACGALFTSTVATLNSLPITGPLVRAHIFTISWLKPQRTGAYEISAETRIKLDDAKAERGDSLLGKSNVTGFVLISVLPFLIGAVRNIKYGATSKLIFNAAIILSFFALLFTYSRLTYLAIALLLYGYLLFDRQVFSKRFLPLIILASIVIGAVGVQSAVFKFSFIADKFDLTNEQYTYTNQARILAYTYPFELIYNDPSYVLRGAGRSFKKLREKDSSAGILQLDGSLSAAMHSVFAASVFYRGFIAMIVFFYLYYVLIKTSYKETKRSKREASPTQWMIIASTISLMSIIPPWAFDHFIVTKMNSHMHLFLIFALVMTCLEYVKSNNQKPMKNKRRKSPTQDMRILRRASHT